jgi:hypothetical protein
LADSSEGRQRGGGVPVLKWDREVGNPFESLERGGAHHHDGTRAEWRCASEGAEERSSAPMERSVRYTRAWWCSGRRRQGQTRGVEG